MSQTRTIESFISKDDSTLAQRQQTVLETERRALQGLNAQQRKAFIEAIRQELSYQETQEAAMAG